MACGVDTREKIRYNSWSVSSTRVTLSLRTVKMGDASPTENKRGAQLGVKRKGGLSVSGRKRLRQRLDAFSYINTRYFVHAMLVTLTIPGISVQDVKQLRLLPKAINSTCQYLRDHGNLYIWVKELQKRGVPHWHFLLNKPEHITALKESWLRSLKKLKLLDFYTQRFRSMSWKQYYNYRHDTDHNVPNISTRRGSRWSFWIKSVQDAYDKGCACQWTDPPVVNYTYISKDRHGKRNVFAYVAKYVTKEKTDDLMGNVFGCSRLYVDTALLKFVVQNHSIDTKLAKLFHADPKIVPFALEMDIGTKIMSYSMYSNRGSLLPYPFRAIYCRFVEQQLLYNGTNVTNLAFTEEDGDYDISQFNEYARVEEDLMFIFCLWREVRHYREKTYGYSRIFVH